MGGLKRLKEGSLVCFAIIVRNLVMLLRSVIDFMVFHHLPSTKEVEDLLLWLKLMIRRMSIMVLNFLRLLFQV